MCRTVYIIVFFLSVVFSLNALAGRTRINNFSVPVERVTVITDRDIYVAGESVFFNVNVTSNDSTNNLGSRVCYMILRDTKNIYSKLYIKINRETGFGSFYLPDTLKTGYYEVVAFTNYMRNFDESLFFRKSLIVVNRFDEWLNNLFQINNPKSKQNYVNDSNLTDPEKCPVKLALEKDSFAVREKIKLTLHLDTDAYNKYRKKISISIKGVNPYTQYLLDWRNPLNSSEMITPFSKEINYPVEKEGIYLSGKLIKPDSTPVQKERLFLSTPDSIVNLQYTSSDEKGQFQFLLSDYYLGKQLIISTESDSIGECIILLEDKFQLNQPFHHANFILSKDLRKYIIESQKIVAIQKTYALKYLKTVPVKNSAYEFPRIYNGPTAIVYPSDYVPLNNLMEISENILTTAKIAVRRGKYIPYVLNTVTAEFFPKPAGVFLDGFPIYDLTPIMNLSSGDISKIELCNAIVTKGDLEYNGIISIIRSKKTDTLPLNKGIIAYSVGKFTEYSYYDLPNVPNAFYDPTPDFRQLLYWNPLMELKPGENNIEFYSSDWLGNYIIEVKGINNEGEVFLTYSKIKVYR